MRCFRAITLLGLIFVSQFAEVSLTRLQAADPVDSVAPAGSLKDLDGHFPFQVPGDLKSWEQRAEAVRQQLRVALGIWPMPTLAKLSPVRHGRRELDGYIVEKVFFESLPGFYVTGNLYLPANMQADKKYPAVLCPHGHWTEARFFDAGDGEVRRLLAQGEERFESAARNHIQARCVHLARMGCVVFHWDMIGYCDSQQISFDRAHRFAKQDPATEVNKDGWLLFSPKAEELGQSVMGLQTINTQQALEFVLSLPQVDATKVGITGASGGGTQTFIAAALESRFSAAFPAVMVSTAMQGGCTCENASGLRIDTGNIEIAGLIAPRPLGMTAANDWTKEMAKDGFPQLQQLYEMYGKKDRVGLFPSLHYGHNYNHVSRVSMYGWFNQHWGLGLQMPVLERDFYVLHRADLSVWNNEHPKPAGGEEFERKLLKAWNDDQRAQLTAGLREPTDSAAHRKSLELIAAGWRGLLGPGIAEFMSSDKNAESLKWNPQQVGAEGAKVDVQVATISHPRLAQPLLAIARGNYQAKKVLLVVSDEGAAALMAKDGLPEKVKQLANDPQWQVVATDLIGQKSDLGNASISKATQQPLVSNPRLSAAYTFGYNYSVPVKRTHQLLALIAELRKSGVEEIVVTGQGDIAISAAAAAFQAAKEVAGVRIDVASKDLQGAESIKSIDFFPGSQRYFYLPGLLASSSLANVELMVDGKQVSPIAAIVAE